MFVKREKPIKIFHVVLSYLKSVELKTIVNMCTPPKKSIDRELSTKLEDILLRYMTFYCNISETIVNELKHPSGDSILEKSWLTDPVPHGQGAMYFEMFDHVRLNPFSSLNNDRRHFFSSILGETNVSKIGSSTSIRIEHNQQSNQTTPPSDGHHSSNSI